ncbi:MAG: AsmA-like C-terminal region-containing protein [Aureispira sp.]|nr:AsmA-like C-terminal region-containing protein [Aureispira sp.]
MAKKDKPIKDPKKKKNPLMKLLKWLGLLILGVLLILIIAAAFFEEKIGGLVINVLKKSLKTELSVETAELSLIWSFPNASVNLKNVRLEGTGKQAKDLLDVETISLKCGIFGLLTGNYDFNTLKMSNGDIFVHVDEKGLSNYDVFVTDETAVEEETESGELNLSIENAALSNVNVHYIHEAHEQDIKLNFKSAEFEGSFTNDKYDMISNAEIYSDHIEMGEDVYLVGKQIAYDAVVGIDNIAGKYTFEDILFNIEGNDFNVDGSFTQSDKGTEMDMVFETQKARLNSLLQLLPASYQGVLGGFESYANLTFNATVKGLYTGKQLPAINMGFGLKDGYVTHPDMASDMENVNFEVSFTTGDGKSDQSALFELKNFEASLDGDPIGINWKMQGLENPKIDFSFNGGISLAGIYGLLGKQVTNGSGYIDIEELSLNGYYKDMVDTRRISKVKLVGAINFDKASLLVNEIPLGIETGRMVLNNNAFNIANFILVTPNNHIAINGDFQNALPVLFSDSLNSKNAELTFSASLNSQKMDVDELVALGGTDVEEVAAAPEEIKDSITQEKYESREFITQFLKGTFITNILEFKYGKLAANNINGEMVFDNNILSVKGVSMDAMAGHWELNSKVFFEKAPYMEAYLECKGVDMQQLLYQCENFGQDVIQDHQMRGTLNSLIKVNASFDEVGNFMSDDLKVLADVDLQNGELIGLKMLEDFSAFIKLKDLRHIKFTNLRNQFKIEKGVFHIPAMFIRSNALNLTIAAKHSFNQDMDYKVKVNVGQVLAAKMKKYNPDMKPLKARQKGLFNIYVRYWGNLYGETQWKKGKKHAKKELDEQLAQDLPAIANTLRAEFSGASVRSGNSPTADNVQTLKEPEEWTDLGEGEDEYVEWQD